MHKPSRLKCGPFFSFFLVHFLFFKCSEGIITFLFCEVFAWKRKVLEMDLEELHAPLKKIACLSLVWSRLFLLSHTQIWSSGV